MGGRSFGFEEIVRRPLKPTLEKLAKIWAQEEWAKEGKQTDRLAEAHAAARLSGVAPQMGG